MASLGKSTLPIRICKRAYASLHDKWEKKSATKFWLNRVKEKKYYYHITETPFDNNVLSPRTHGDRRSDSEPLISRICVAPTVEGCLCAIPYQSEYFYIKSKEAHRNHGKYFIYRTKDKVWAYHTRSVYDSKSTGEKWLLNRTSFVKVGILMIPNSFPQIDCMEDADNITKRNNYRKLSGAKEATEKIKRGEPLIDVVIGQVEADKCFMEFAKKNQLTYQL